MEPCGGILGAMEPCGGKLRAKDTSGGTSDSCTGNCGAMEPCGGMCWGEIEPSGGKGNPSFGDKDPVGGKMPATLMFLQENLCFLPLEWKYPWIPRRFSILLVVFEVSRQCSAPIHHPPEIYCTYEFPTFSSLLTPEIQSSIGPRTTPGFSRS